MDKIQKKILIMGGGINQTSLIEAARKEGYYTVLCDANPNALCSRMADKFCTFDISNGTLLTQIAKNNNVDGIVCNTESLMSTLAVVQSNLGAVGNTVESVENISDKYKFRKIQKNAHTFAPEIEKFSEYNAAKLYVDTLKEDLIIKPELSSGSRGVSIIKTGSSLSRNIFDECISFSRNGHILIERFIDFRDKVALEAEVFILNGRVELLCLFRTIRDRKLNILPQCYCSGTDQDEHMKNEIQNVLQKVFKEAGITWGEYNVELSFTPTNQIFIIEINARQGGMRLPEFVQEYTGIDLDRLLVTTAVNDFSYLNTINRNTDSWDNNYIHYRVLLDTNGTYGGYEISDELGPFLTSEFDYIEPGTIVNKGNNQYVTVALLDFKFDNIAQRKKYEDCLDELVTVNIS